MTALLLRRELRRQLTVALAAALLGVLAYVIVRLGAPLLLNPVQAEDLVPFAPQVALGLVGLVTPWLLGVSALAPDIESGAAAFLGALPMRRGRLAATRLAVAAGLTLVVVAPFALFALASSAPPRLDGREAAAGAILILAIGLTPLAAGALTGLVTGRSLPAFAATPLLVGVLGVAGLLMAGVFSHLGELTASFGLATVPLLVVALVLVGVRRGVGVRSGDGLRFGLAALAALVLTTGGLGGVAFAVGAGTTTWPERSWSRRGPLVVWQDVRHRATYPFFSSGEVVAFTPAAVPIWIKGEQPVGLRLGPHSLPFDLSPDWRRLVLYDMSSRDIWELAVVDLASGAELLRSQGAWTNLGTFHAPPHDGFVRRGDGRGWRRGVPVLVEPAPGPPGSALMALDGERLAPPLAGALVTDLRGRWALLTAPGGLHAWDLDTGRTTAFPGSTGGQLVGDGLVALLEPDSALRLVRLEDGATTLRASLGDLSGVRLDVDPSRDGAAALVWRTVTADPSNPRERPLLVGKDGKIPLSWHDGRRSELAWSTDGRRLAFANRGVIDVARPSELRPLGLVHGQPFWGVRLVGFADERTLLTTVQDMLWAVDVETGDRRLLPHPVAR